MPAERAALAAVQLLLRYADEHHGAPVDGYTIDIVRGDLLIEIQTRNFFAMKETLANLTANHPVHLVHPIAVEKWIIRLGQDGSEPAALFGQELDGLGLTYDWASERVVSWSR